MIIICGIPSETPLAMVATELDKLNVPHIVFNQREFATYRITFKISNGGVIKGNMQLNDGLYSLEHIRGVYIRLMDDQLLPELENEPINSPKRLYCRSLHDTLIRWCEIAPCRVINRTFAMSSNSSKPYQAQIIRNHGFSVPETLITNEPSLVREFYNKHKRIVYKSISGVRSIVDTLSDADFERLDQIRWCPVQFQQFVEGINVRVHVINATVFSTLINSDATDYRYAHRTNKGAELQEIDLPEELAKRCVNLSQRLGLEFSGIDLMITADNKVFCFEVNPSPAFSYFEANTGQPIAHAVACHLAGIQ